jgi:hypothetical protein
MTTPMYLTQTRKYGLTMRPLYPLRGEKASDGDDDADVFDPGAQGKLIYG